MKIASQGNIQHSDKKPLKSGKTSQKTRYLDYILTFHLYLRKTGKKFTEIYSNKKTSVLN